MASPDGVLVTGTSIHEYFVLNHGLTIGVTARPIRSEGQEQQENTTDTANEQGRKAHLADRKIGHIHAKPHRIIGLQ